MKQTKRFLSLFLALVLCLGMAACSSADDKAFEAADALLAAGDYDGAIAAFSAIGRYQEISAKIAEAEILRTEEKRLLEEANIGFLLGSWVDIKNSNIYTFDKDHEGTLTYPSELNWEPYSFYYNYSDGILTLIGEEVSVHEIDGITHLISENGEYDLVPEAFAPDLAPYKVEITMDNWQEYFELRRADNVYFNAFGEPEYRDAGYGFFLKDEYVEQLVDSYASLNASDVSLEVQYDEAWFTVSGDFLSGDYELSPSDAPNRYLVAETGKTQVASVSDMRDWDVKNKDDFSNTVSADFTRFANRTYNDVVYLIDMVNVEVIRISGTLILRR